MAELQHRAKKILFAVVTEFIATGLPMSAALRSWRTLRPKSNFTSAAVIA